jgi:hypothetical protein
MGLQIVIDGHNISGAVRALDAGGVICETFPMSLDRFGISISSGILDSVGEAAMAKVLSEFTYVDLWSGDTHERPRQ